MIIKDITAEELKSLQSLEKKNFRKALLTPLFYVLPVILVGFIPAKYLPRRLRNTNNNTYLDESIIDLVGGSNFFIFIVCWSLLMTWATLATYKNLSIKKDLKDRKKREVEGVVTYVGFYDGEHFVRLKKGTGVNILKFDHSNYRPLQVGDKVDFEVYDHSKILIRILKQASKPLDVKMVKPLEVTDKCPACNHPLSEDELECPDCGLNFS